MNDVIWVVVLVLTFSLWAGTLIYVWTLPPHGRKAFWLGFWNMFGFKSFLDDNKDDKLH